SIPETGSLPTIHLAPQLTSMLNRLESSTAVGKGPQLEDVARQFEGTFISMLLKEMRQTLSGDGFFAGDKTDTYGSLFDMFMGQHLSQAGGLGIERALLKYQENSLSARAAKNE
ncbi:MAG: rod-binding protein, partial [Planctomycetales bacterium]|nr:rod-binding protein [Planctomycetales bacterium]